MELHESLAELVAAVGPQVLDDADGFRAALDDYLDEGSASTGDINLLVDTVRLGAYAWMVNTIASGGEGGRAVEAAGSLLARDRGSRDLDSARWACAVLGFAVGKVGDADVRRYRTRSLAPLDAALPPHPGPDAPGPVVAADASTEPVQPPMPPPPVAAAPPARGASADETVLGESPADLPPVRIAPEATGPAASPAAPPARRRARPLLALLVVLVLVGGGLAAWQLLRDDGDGGDATAASDPTGPSGATSPDVTDRPDYRPVPADPEPLPFAVDADFVNQPCTGELVVMLATAGVPDNYETKLGNAVAGVPDAKVLRASDSCDGFQDLHPESGQPIYNAYLGPYATVADACATIGSLASRTAWVRELADPSQERELCFCLDRADALPAVGAPGVDTDALPVIRDIGQLQWALYLDELIDKDAVFNSYGVVTPGLRDAVRAYQAEVGLDETGEVDADTWTALQGQFCETTAYDVDR